MPLVTETGEALHNAESWGTAEGFVAYWEARPHRTESEDLANADDEHVEGALRDAAQYITAAFEEWCKGWRVSNLQALAFPRLGMLDDHGYAMPTIPGCVIEAQYELASKVVLTGGALQTDQARGGNIKEEEVQAAVVRRKIVYGSTGAGQDKVYSFVQKLLSPVLKSTGRKYVFR